MIELEHRSACIFVFEVTQQFPDSKIIIIKMKFISLFIYLFDFV